MTERKRKALLIAMFGSLVLIVTSGFSPAQPIPLKSPTPAEPLETRPQEPPPRPAPLPLPLPGEPGFPGQPAGQPEQPVPPVVGPQPAEPDPDDIEVLAKGPVHEGFATTAEPPTEPSVDAKKPPEPVEELPPDQKPEGDNVQWLPGYWHWDEESSQFSWVSGFWRQPPPGRVWVPGSWRAANGGWQWVPGFWQEVNPQPGQPGQPAQPEIEYLPQPPAPIEVGPSTPAPGDNYFYSPGSWVWQGRCMWRPGCWIEHRPDWVLAPARYCWTPAGYIFNDCYWDYLPASRGCLFAPLRFKQPFFTQLPFFCTPKYVVSNPCLFGSLFVRNGHCNYFFGDYFAPKYNTLGYHAWCGTYGRNGFNIGFGVGRNWCYDPFWCHFSCANRGVPKWHNGVYNLYAGRYGGDIPPPPATLVQQNTVINNIAKTNVKNVTNNITVVN